MCASTSILSRSARRLFGTPATGMPRRARLRSLAFRPVFEPLEDRRLLSVSPYGLDSLPALHSNPGASATLFLDFDGHFESLSFGVPNVTTPAYDFDGDPTTFSDAELANVEAIWFRVAEDYAPFNIDVTTVEPAVLAPGVPADDANGVALRVAIGGTSDWHTPGLAGVSSPNMFTNSVANVAYAFAQGNDRPSVGDVVSHEAGHSFGLVHQSASTNPDALITRPIMYGSNGIDVFETWYNGITAFGDVQDDMAIIAGATNGFGYRADDHGNTTAAATTLTQVGNTWGGNGIVGTNTDVDMYSFTVTTQDTYRIAVNGFTGTGGDVFATNLDVALELRNSAGSVIASANPQAARSAEIRRELTPGTYYLGVKTNGVYGQLGQYTVTMDTPPAGVTVTPAMAAPTTGEDGRTASLTVVLETAPTAPVTIAAASTNTAEGTVSAASLVFTSANWDIPQVLTISGVDDGIVDHDLLYHVNLGAASSADLEYGGLDPADIGVVNVDNDEAGFVYRPDSVNGTIQRSRLSGSQPETLVDFKALFGATGFYSPGDIAVDEAGGTMYWTDSSQKAIQRANLDGSNVVTLISAADTTAFTRLALDVAAGKMYWNDNGNPRKIQRANLDGSQIQDLVTPSGPTMGLALDTDAGKMYWTERSSSLHSIRRANLDGSLVEILWTNVPPVPNSLGPTEIALDVAAGKMYWADQTLDLIRRANLDGTNVEVLVNTAALGNGSQVSGLTLDVPADKLYWTDNGTDTIYRANLDGSLIANLGSGAGLRGLAIAHLAPDISVTHRSGLVTLENGASDLFRVTLTAQPTANVTVALSSSDPAEGTLSASSLTFTPDNWNITQTVTVSGVNDAVVDGDIAYTIVVAAAVSGDPNYQGLDAADVSLVNLDDDVLPTKFYVVDDASQNVTYEYNANGGLVESYSLNSGNTVPRGAASTIAGDRTWVVDANRKVYVYDAGGGLLGSWTAGTLPNNATVEGIAVAPNGTDVWIVDAKGDKVYRYAGAATRLSGSQNAASSFNLNSGNTSPKDIVSDGASLWVVNDSNTDKVFKYTAAGSLLGSWIISTSGASSPTGITIDPANVGNIWIVDSGTDKIYQYNDAASRTSGSQTAAATYALAAGNTNPQGIADPPPPDSESVASPALSGTPANWRAAGGAAWGAGLAATTAALGTQATDRFWESFGIVASQRDVDEIMSRLVGPPAPVRSPASAAPATAIVSRRPAMQRSDVPPELADGDLDESIDLISRDLLEMGLCRRGK